MVTVTVMLMVMVMTMMMVMIDAVEDDGIREGADGHGIADEIDDQATALA